MRRHVLLFCLMLFFVASSFAQFNQKNRKQSNNDGESSSFFDKLYFAGGGGFGSGTNANGRYSYYSLLPTIGYRVSPQILVAINISYSKYNFPDVGPGVSYSQTGYAPFVRYYLQQLFFQVEYDLISANIPDANAQGLFDSQKKYYDRFFLGLGFAQPLGKRSAINVLGMYDVLYQQYPAGPFISPYVLRVFFSY